MKEKKNKKITFYLNSKFMCFLFFIIGCALIAISNMDFKDSLGWWNAWAKGALNNAGTTLLVAGVISFFIEISSLRHFFQDSMKNILNNEFPFDAYSKKNLENFKNLLSAYIVDRNAEELVKETIYSYEKILLKMASERYYEYHNLSSVIYPDEKGNKIVVKCTTDYKIINLYEKKNNVQYINKIYASSEEDAKKRYKISKLIINGIDQDTNSIIKYKKTNITNESNFYDYKVIITLDFGNQKNVIVHMEYEHTEPLFDKFESYKITLPCKKLEHDIRINNGWSLTGTAFTAFYFTQKEADSTFRVNRIAPDSIRINFNNWVLPGGGYALYYDNDRK